VHQDIACGDIHVNKPLWDTKKENRRWAGWNRELASPSYLHMEHSCEATNTAAIIFFRTMLCT
jgi:hypothetical protein